MTLSRCGRVYPTFDAALKAAELRSIKSGKQWWATTCALSSSHWHVVTREADPRPDPFPPVVARQLAARDKYCGRCGRGGRLEDHHRRGKHMGGSKGRAHTQCACNGLRLCRTCHAYVHDVNPGGARDAGWIVRQAESFPMRVHVFVCIGLDDGNGPVYDECWPTCDGQWVHSPLETET